MIKDTTKEAAGAAEALLFDDWFDAIEDGVRSRVRGFIETMLEAEVSEALSRPRYGRRRPGEDEATASAVGVRHGHRERTLTGTFGRRDRRAAGPVDRRGRQDARMAKRFAARLPAPHPGGRRLDRRGLSRGDQHPPRAPRVERGVCRSGRQGRGQPRLAQDEGRLGRLECALARRRADRATDPRRDGRARPARQKGDLDLVARRARRARRRPENAACDQEHGRRERGGLRALLDDLVRRGLPTPAELVVV